jgi:hypothetical protein
VHALAWSSRAQCWCRDGLSLFFCFQVAVWNHMSAHLARGRHAHVARAGRHVCPTCFYRAPAASALDMHMRIHKYVRCQGSAYCRTCAARGAHTAAGYGPYGHKRSFAATPCGCGFLFAAGQGRTTAPSATTRLPPTALSFSTCRPGPTRTTCACQSGLLSSGHPGLHMFCP